MAVSWCGSEEPRWLSYGCKGLTATVAVLTLLTCLIVYAAVRRVIVLCTGKYSHGMAGSNALSIPLLAALAAATGSGAVMLGTSHVPPYQTATQAAMAAIFLALLVRCTRTAFVCMLSLLQRVGLVKSHL